MAFVLAGAMLGPVDCEVTPCEIRDGVFRCVLDTPHPADEYVLILGSLAPWNQSGAIRVRAEPTTDAVHLPREMIRDDEGARAALRLKRRQLADARKQAGQPDQFMPILAPPQTKTFHLFVGERDLDNPDQYQAVAARLHSFNKVAQVYVDGDTVSDRVQDDTVAEVLRTFAEDVLPWASRHLGKADDVDRDGRFTFFLTGQMARMRKGKTLDGFTRGSDFFLELSAPFSNRCDMVVLNRALKPGPHLRTVLLHEFTHAVSFCGHALRDYPTGPRRQDDETWLSESLAHLVEDIRGYSRSNLEERVRAYLEAPHEYPLVIPDTFAAGMWRTPGVRGGGFLFLRHAYGQTGSELLSELAQSNLRGKENLETATGRTFPFLLHAFAVDLAKRSFIMPCEKGNEPTEGTAKALLLTMDDRQMEVRLPGSAICFIHLRGASAARSCVTLRCGRGLAIQATLVRLPRNP